MPVITDISKHRKKIADAADRFAIKNFILSDTSMISQEQSLDEAMIFDGFVLIICLKGKAVFKLNYREHTVNEGMIFTYMPGQIFQLIKRSENFVIENLFISVDYILQLPLPKELGVFKMISDAPTRKVSSKTIHDMLELHSLAAKYHHRDGNDNRELQTKALLFTLILEIGFVYSDAVPEIPKALTRQEVLTDNFFKLLIDHFKTKRSVGFYADKLCLTAKYLSMTVKKVTGHPISEWINEVVIIEAKRMLKATDMTVLQISEELNFPNPSFFGRFFKQYAGITPVQYKNS